jgi:hypothetical protein
MWRDMACKICIAQRIALGWLFRWPHYQLFTVTGGAKLTQLELLHAIARLNARHALN